MSDVGFFSSRIEKGLSKLVNVLFQKFIFNVYYTFDKLRNLVKIERKCLDVKNVKYKKEDIFPIVTNFENAKKNIEQTIDLLLIVLNTFKGNPTVIQQFVLENYTNNFFKESKKSNIAKLMKENYNKRPKKNTFYETKLMSCLCKNAKLSNKRKEKKLGDSSNSWENEDDDMNMYSFKKIIHKMENIIENEKIVIRKNEKTKKNYYNSTFSNINNIWEKKKKYTKRDLVNILNNVLVEFYLKKQIYDKIENTVLEQKVNLSNESFEDKEESHIKKQFFGYFNDFRRNEQLDILLEEVNIKNIFQFYNMLAKEVESVQLFYDRNIKEKGED